MNFPKTICSKFIFGIVLLVQTVFNVPLTYAASVPVRVTNTPLPVQGAVNANITNSSVSVSGAVEVSNSPDTPLYTEIENAARTAVGASCSMDFTDPPSQVRCQLGTVPNDKILVIETITCRANTSIGGSIGPLLLMVATPNIDGTSTFWMHYDLALTKTSTIADVYDMYTLTSQIRVYAAPGGVSVIGIGEKPLNARTGMTCTIAGHLVNQ